MAQLENIEAIEKRLWDAADTLRANSNCASNEYFMPVMGLIFLRHAYSRYLAVKDGIEANLPKRGGKARPLTKEDFSQKGAIFLRPEAQFDYLVSLPDSAKRDRAIQHAMDTIEEDYDGLKGVLPRGEYSELDNEVLGQLLRTLNPEELKQASGDIFGRIYEYFLTQFADLKAHDNGEFFTPVSLVRMIANVIEPDHGKVLDPACGSGGMFVQSAHFVERMRGNPSEVLTFYGMEKNPTTIRLAKMNLAVHGLEGDIQKAITYYEDPHELAGKADFVMANPPFNVDEVDADKIKNDPRLPFGLPGVNKAGKVSNGNYLWISYFHSYLSPKGRAGFVMSSQASSAGHTDKTVRQKLVETGDVDVMIAIRANFFYTRTVPCELWFFDRSKPKERKDKVLMLDARNVYRKVTRKIYDFSPEQMKNLSAIMWLYRKQQQRFLALVKDYLGCVCTESVAVPDTLESFDTTLADLRARFDALAATLAKSTEIDASRKQALGNAAKELSEAHTLYQADAKKLLAGLHAFEQKYAKALPERNDAQHTGRKAFDPMAEAIRGLVRQVDLLYKLAARVADLCAELAVDDALSGAYDRRVAGRLVKQLDEARRVAVEQLKQTVYFHRQAAWLQDHFPKAVRLRFPGHEHTHITNGAPEGWEQRPLGECARFLSGGTPSKARADFWGGDISWVSSGELTTMRIHRTTLSLTPEAVDVGSRLVPGETILAVVRGMSLAKEFRIGLTCKPMAFNQDVKAIIPQPDVDRLLLYHTLDAQREQIRDKTGEASHGTKKLDSKVLSEIQILVPPQSIQQHFSETVTTLHAQWDLLEEQNYRLHRARDLLLPRLMSGEITV